MTPISVCIANAMLWLVMRLTPADRREWARAMQAELRHSDASNALPFAMGCLWAIVKIRAVAPVSKLDTAKWLLVFGATAWSALHLWLAGQLAADDAAMPATFAYLAAALIAIGAAMMAAGGLRTAIMLAVPAFVVAVFGAIGIDAWPTNLTHAAFYRAMAMEYATILTAALLIAVGARYWAKQHEGPSR